MIIIIIIINHLIHTYCTYSYMCLVLPVIATCTVPTCTHPPAELPGILIHVLCLHLH